MELHVKDSFDPEGLVRVKSYKGGTLERATPFANEYMRLRKMMALEFDCSMLVKLANEAHDAFARMEEELAKGLLGTPVSVANMVMQGTLTGKDLFVEYLIGGTIYTGINYGAIGTGSTSPAVSDTELDTEVHRVVPTTVLNVGNNQAQLRFFMPDGALANATYREFGTFMNASATPDSGQIFNRALFSPVYVKTAGLDTTVEVDFTLT